MNIVDLDSPIAVRELAGVSVLPHVRVVTPDGSIALEKSGTADEVIEDIKNIITGGHVFTCPMHPEMREQQPGACPTCGMRLIRASSSSP